MSSLGVRIEHRTETFHLQIDTSITLSGVTALFGPSGSGKTSVLDCIAGLRPGISDANIRFDAQSWQAPDSFLPAWKRRVGYVFQDARLFPQLNVRDNIGFGTRYGSARGDMQAGSYSLAQLAQWLDIETLLDQAATALSAGQQQRVAIARALASNPRLLLLDEPVANLDRSAARKCLACLRQIGRESGMPMIYVSHQLEEVAAIADQLVLMQQGRVVRSGPLLELAGRLDNPLAEEESAAAILRVELGDHDTRYGLTRATAGDAGLWLSARGVPGSHHRLRIPARDVSVCLQPPAGSSILNILPVTLLEQRAIADAHCLLRLRLGDQHLLARISRRSRDELDLKIGDSLYAQIKSTALLSDELSP